MKYIVMECHFSYAILLDEEGRFLKAANRNYQVGQTVYDPVLIRSVRRYDRSFYFRAARRLVALAAVFFLIFAGISYYRTYYEPYSTVVMTINPEVELELNRKGEVVKLSGANADGIALIDGYDGKGKDKVTVADELLDRAIQMGYLTDGSLITFQITSPDNDLWATYGEELRTGVADHLAGRVSASIDIVGDDLPAPGEQPTAPQTPITTDPPPVTNTPPADEYIGVERAKEIALNHAGLSDVTFETAELDEDDGRMVYELEFSANGTEYQYEIDAKSGAILDHSSDTDDDD